MRAGFIAILLTFVLIASNARGTNVILGSGISSCGEWLSDKSLRNLRVSWVLGYVSALNRISSIDFLEGREWKGIAAAVDKYCRDYPLNDLEDAAKDVTEQMKRMKK